MKVVFFLMLLVASFYFVEDGFAQIREESSRDPKIHPTIANWQSSSDPESFAKNNDLSASEDMIAVYIHLDSEESISSLPQDINVVSSDENIAVAFVSSSQIDQLAQLDFVERIALPPIGRNPPIPSLDDSGDIETISAIIIGVAIAIGIGIFSVKRRRVQHA